MFERGRSPTNQSYIYIYHIVQNNIHHIYHILYIYIYHRYMFHGTSNSIRTQRTLTVHRRTLPPPAFQGRQVLGRALTRMFSGGFEARGRRTSRKKRPDMFCYMTIYHKSPWKITSSINCTRISRQIHP